MWTCGPMNSQLTITPRTTFVLHFSRAMLNNLMILMPPASTVADGRYRFHPSIERVSGQLFRDGHFQQAALTTYIEVIDTVKKVSGLALDGDPLNESRVWLRESNADHQLQPVAIACGSG